MKDKSQIADKLGCICITFMLTIFIGIVIGALYARVLWKTASDHYLEVKHQYDYCPYCGEYIGD